MCTMNLYITYILHHDILLVQVPLILEKPYEQNLFFDLIKIYACQPHKIFNILLIIILDKFYWYNVLYSVFCFAKP